MTDLENFNNLNYIYDAWDEPATPIPADPVAEPVEPVVDPNGWNWFPDANGQLFTLYFDADGNECMMWQLQDDGSFHWRCADVGYTCREIGIEGRRGIFFQDLFVGSMILDENLTVTWLPETYIMPHDQINNIYNINVNDININIENIYDDYDSDDSDEDDSDP